MERILAILSEETEYSQELAAYLMNRRDFIFRPIVFTCVDAYLEHIRTHKVDMLVCDEELIDNADIEATADTVCVLVKNSFVAEEHGYPGVFKYQSSENLMKEIIKCYAKKENCSVVPTCFPEEKEKPQLICVCTPVGGSYSSTFALALAKYRALGERTLFISFDPFFSVFDTEKNPAERNLTDILYYLQTSQRDPMEFITKITKKSGDMEYLEGAAHWFDIAEARPEHVIRLIEAIERSKSYKTIVVDLCAQSTAGIELLMACRKIYVPVGSNTHSQKKLIEWKRQLSFIEKEEVLEKLVEIQVPYDERLSEGVTGENILKGRLGRFIEETEGLRYIK